MILEEAGILGDISVEEFPLYFTPLEQDVLSLGLQDSFGDLYLVSAALTHLLCGQFP
jgi:vacuolar protein sorting-associated protein 33A